MRRYEVITHSYDSGVDQKENTYTIQEAKAIIKDYLTTDDYYDSAAIYDYKTKKIIALYNGFSQDHIAADYRNSNAKVYWIEKEA